MLIRRQHPRANRTLEERETRRVQGTSTNPAVEAPWRLWVVEENWVTLKFTAHAIRRMRTWRLSDDDVLHILATGAVIEAYPSDAPFPSRLVLGWIQGRPIHVVAADNPGAQETVVITVYEPDPHLWDPTFRTRRQPQ